ncbi:integral membrane protein [Penicillium brasilianum]|uniref:Integral membrane protein n=1 Tax=Penicillium brasilianum TaxID=104259 RepID=A0A1S9S163_PENBI|nr:integral membrane protein [Penicillium brasilianum]
MHENPNQANEAYGWHFQYLTVIGLSLSTLTFIVAFLADVTLSRRLFLIKNLLSVCCAPMEVLISVLYWGLRVIDERLVLPEWAVIPLHAGTLTGLIALMAASAEDGGERTLKPADRSRVPCCPVHRDVNRSAAAVPTVDNFRLACSWYPYPIFEQLSTSGRVGLFSMSAVVMAFSTVTLKWLHGRVNGFGSGSSPQSRPGDIKKEGL